MTSFDDDVPVSPVEQGGAGLSWEESFSTS